MTTRSKLWLTSFTLYAVFFCWYTDFRAPLTEEEIDEFVAVRLADGADPAQIARAEDLFRGDTGRQFLMFNAIDYNETPDNVEGAEPDSSAEELMALYMQYMLPAMLARGSHPVIMGDTFSGAMDLVGIDGAEEWDSGAVLRYRSRRTLMDIIGNPEFRGGWHFKHAALTKTIAFPIETQLYLGDLRWIAGLLMLAVTALLDAFVFTKKSA